MTMMQPADPAMRSTSERVRRSRAFDVLDAPRAARLALALIVVVQLLLCCYFVCHKTGLFQDESYTLFLANSSWMESVPQDGVVYEGGQPHRDWIEPAGFLEVDFGQVIQNQVDDVHPPLYYLILACLCALLPFCSPIFVALGLNVLAVCATTPVLYLLARALGGNRVQGLLLALFWAVSPAMINSCLYIRMYTFLALLFTVIALLCARVASAGKCSWILSIVLCFTTLCAALTQHFFFIFGFILYLAVGVTLLVRKKWGDGVRFGLGVLAGVVLDFVLFPAAYQQMFHGYRGEEALGNAVSGDTFGSFLVQDWRQLDTGNFGGLLPLIVAIVVVGYAVYRMRGARGEASMRGWFGSERAVAYACLLVAAVGYAVVIARVAPYASIRYLLPVQPVLECVVMLPLFMGAFWLLGTNRVRSVVTSLCVVAVIAGCGYSYGIKYFDQENDDVAALAQENGTMVGVWKTWMMSQALLPDVLEYDKAVFFSSLDSFESFDLESLGRFSLYIDGAFDVDAYLAYLKEAYAGVQMRYVGETIDHYQVYDVLVP